MIGNKKPAFTLIEVIVSVAIFAVIIITSSQIFQASLNAQIENIDEVALQEDVKYALEFMSRQARGAIKNTSGSTLCGVDADYTYATDGSTLYFQDAYSACVTYTTEVDVNGVQRILASQGSLSHYITSPRTDVESLKFIVADDPSTVKPLLTLNFQAKSKTDINLPALSAQISVSSNWYAP